MLDNGAEATAMEVSSVALDQGRTECVDFDVAVFTNLTRDHLDYHGTMEQYRESKAKLFRTLVDAERQRAVINLDEPEPERGRREGEGAANDDDDAEGDEADAASDAASDASSDAASDAASDSSDSTSDAAFFIAAAGGGDRVPVVTYATQRKFEREADVFVEKAELTLFETTLTIRTPAGSIDTLLTSEGSDDSESRGRSTAGGGAASSASSTSRTSARPSRRASRSASPWT